jgi:hypothetical protein
MKVWIVGKPSKVYETAWAFVGVYSSKAKAVRAAKRGRAAKFIGPAVVDLDLPEKAVEWPGSYYVKKGKKRVR